MKKLGLTFWLFASVSVPWISAPDAFAENLSQLYRDCKKNQVPFTSKSIDELLKTIEEATNKKDLISLIRVSTCNFKIAKADTDDTTDTPPSRVMPKIMELLNHVDWKEVQKLPNGHWSGGQVLLESKNDDRRRPFQLYFNIVQLNGKWAWTGLTSNRHGTCYFFDCESKGTTARHSRTPFNAG